MSEIYQILRAAVLSKTPVCFDYQGRWREVCPHQLGTNATDDEQMLGYQFGGQSSSGTIGVDQNADWRCFKVAQIANVMSIEAEWQSHSGHSKPATCVKNIDVEAEG